MLHRRSTKSKLSLARRKSTSTSSTADRHHQASIVVLEHLDPALARRDAHIAAWEAYARAQSRARADAAGTFPPMSSSPPSVGRRQAEGERGERTDLNNKTLRRSQSVRFVGPCSGSEGIVSPPAPLLSKAPEGYIDARVAGVGCFPPEDDVASAPSSYRRRPRHLRRSRSWLGDIRGRGRLLATGSLKALDEHVESSTSLSRRIWRSDLTSAAASFELDETEEGAEQEERVRSAEGTTRLRRTKPTDFLSHGRRNRHGQGLSSYPSDAENTIVALPDLPEDGADPRDHRQRRHSTARARRKASLSWFGSWNPSQHTLLHHRKSEAAASLSTSSRDGSVDEDAPEDAGDGPSATPLPDEKEEQQHPAAAAAAALRLRARKASRSFRTKLRSLFGSSSHSQGRSEEDDGEKGPELPLQHIPSRRSHHRESTLIFPLSLCSSPARTAQLVRSPTPSGMARSREASVKVHHHQQQPPPSHARRQQLQVLGGEQTSKPADLAPSTGNTQGRDNTTQDAAQRNPSSSTASGGGDSNDSSSLTSWVHSGPSTLTSIEQRQWREWETKQQALREQLEERLRGIKGKDGKGQASSAPALPACPMVSSDRIYSALVKRMREKDGRALPSCLAAGQGEQQKQPAEENVAPVTASKNLSGCLPGSNHGDKTPDTIRRVVVPRPSEDGGEARKSECSSQASFSSSEQTRTMTTPTRTSRRSGGGGSGGSGGSMSRTACGSLPAQHQDQAATSNLGSRQVRHAGALGTWKPSSSSVSVATDVSGQTRWREGADDDAHHHHTDAGGSLGSDHLFRTESPYRRALERSMMEEEQKVWARRASEGSWGSGDGGAGVDGGGPDPHVGLASAERRTGTGSGDGQLGYSESVCSSDSGGDVGPLRCTWAKDKRASYVGHDGTLSNAYGERGGALRETSTASSTGWKMWLSAHASKREIQQTMSLPEHPDPDGGFAGRYHGLTVDSLNRRLRGCLSARGHVREAAQIGHDDDDDDDDDDHYDYGGNHSEDDGSNYDDDITSNADHAEQNVGGHPDDVFGPASHRRRVSQQHAPSFSAAATASMIEHQQHPTGPLKPVEPNLPSPHGVTKHPPGRDSTVAVAAPRKVSAQVKENRRPSTRHPPGHALRHPLPAPTQAKSPFRPEPLRPEPLRIMRRQRPFRDGEAWKGQGLQGPPPSPSAASVLSSPGLTEAVRRQFGGGGGMSSLSEVVTRAGAGGVKASPGGEEGSSGVYAFV
ncbi:hypothetical protein VTJ83DRAFT_1781 [Remersonia thermophila]|uniref:Uncharacterized protein n=1 Tax=Remersonia thermophila TaxID=72144 RepID=A0ABR4DJ73_9PEZI